MEDLIFKILVYLINSVQMLLIIILGVWTDCLIQFLFLSLIFFSLKDFFEVKHFPILLCTLITFIYYALSSCVINMFPTIRFVPLLLGILLIVGMNFFRKK